MRGQPPLLVSAAKEPTGEPGQYAAHLRLWDVAAEKSLTETRLAVDPNSVVLPPGLAAWRTGNGPTDAAVGVSWWDKQLRVWDAARQTVQPAADGSNNGAAAFLAPGRFLTASLVKWDDGTYDGGVRAWQVQDGGAPTPIQPQLRLKSNDPNNPFLFPHELAVFSSANGPIDSALVLARRQGLKASDKDDDLLLLLDLTTGKEVGRCVLGPMLLNSRRAAVSPNGKYVAVADADHQRVLMLSIADLKGAGNVRPQVLRSDGTTFDVVAFRKKGDSLGLFLGEKQGDGRFVFDFAKGDLLPSDGDWKDDAPDTTGWKLDPRDGDRKTPGAVAVTGPKIDRTIDLGVDARPTAWTVLPPHKDQPPLLAVGWLDKNRQPWLALYDLTTGVQIRQLAGHAGLVRTLAFSGDGRLLASAGDDQTVCVWTMTDLDQVLGKAGALRDVIVTTNDKGDVVVAQAPPDSPLQRGAVVEGVVENNQLRKFADPEAFYTAFFDAKPGAEVLVRIRPAGAAQAKDVKATVGQGTDERKPLLCLFVTTPVGGPPTRRQWIGWTMLGPYEASSRAAETYLGWHFNPDPDKPGASVDFARAETYRGKYESPGVLRYVTADADAAEGYDDWKNHAPPPNPEVWIDGVDPLGPQHGDRPLVRTRALTLHVELPTGLPVDRVSAARWRMDDQPWQPLNHVRDRAWSADLSQADWGRGRHAVQVRMETDDGRRHIDKEATAFLYLPEAPHIDFPRDWSQKNLPSAAGDLLEAVVKDAAFSLEADVKPAAGNEGVRVTLIQGEGKPVELEGPNVAVRQQFTLTEGVNVLELRATNKDAPKEFEREETTIRLIRLNYFKNHAAPTIALSAAVGAGAPVPAGAAALVTAAPKVVVKGRVEGPENLEDVTGRDGKTLPSFTAGTAKTFAFEDKIDLKPGPQDVEYAARTKDSPAAKATMSFDYQPPTARIHSVTPADQSDVLEKEIPFRADLDLPDDPQPFDAEVRVNDRPQRGVTLNAKRDLLTGKITLDPGLNRITVRLFNQWGASAVHELHVTYRRPPRIATFQPPAKVEGALVDLQTDVVSPADLKPTEARLNDVPFRDDRLKADFDPKTGHWTLTLRGVVLKEGKNVLSLIAANADGPSPPAAAEVEFTKPPPPKPIVKFRDYRDGAYDAAAPREVVLTFSAEAADPANPMIPLERVELWEGNAVRWQAALRPGDLKVEHAETVKLQPATPTTFRLIAVNAAGGQSTASITLQTPQPPAYVVIDRLESLDPGGKRFPPDRIDDQGAVFNEVPEGALRLQGRIIWNGAADGLDRTAVGLRVYANGFQQVP
ncbi:MAG TPA: WD40 repeat domain-containing protein, partial [Gemmataceae bacterium]|nr:WD40 repeat domain-containing protein [Gemmataceae bacterium]